MNRSAAKAGVGECKGSSYWGGARGAERHTDCTTVDGVKSHHTDQLKEENEAMDWATENGEIKSTDLTHY